MERHAIDVGSKKQLFVDRMFIDSGTGVELVMNPPYQSGEPVLTAEESWTVQSATSLGIYNSAMQEDDGRIRIWYQTITSDSASDDDEVYVCYAESEDGTHFTKPVLDLIEARGTTANNIVIPSKIGGSSVWIDPQAPPEERYKTQAKIYSPPEAWGQLHMHSSPDGIRWKWFQNLQLDRGGWDTQSIVFWDPSIGRYVMYTRYWIAKRHGTAAGNESYRTVRRLESDDLCQWENQSIVMWPDEVDLATYETSVPLLPEGPEFPEGRVPVDYYGASVFKYPDAEGVYIMLANANWQWYERDRVVTSARDDLEVERQETRRVHGPSHFDTRLAVSRDGKNFQRCGKRTPFMRLGHEGSFSSRMIWAMPNPIRMGDELWIYYSGTNRDHDSFVDPAAESHLTGIGRAVMRVDGFVSADANYNGGEIVTPPLRFEGRRLELNLDTGGGGSVLVELQDENGRPIKGYTEKEATFTCGNSVRMPVCWEERQDVSELAGKPIRIRFAMRDCKLYAFQFVSAQEV